MKKTFLILCCFIAPNLAFAQYFPPQKVQKDIEKLEILSDECSGGSGDKPKTWKACKQQEKLAEKIKKNGWCWGANFENAYEYQKVWLPCKYNKN
ncbi:hypothetical protein [Acinetobacter modestus]|uniref:hypothetical protein n=1 Tax=Acinetobacter modestus TaxID=1776740 RepID=UPI001F4A5987|nr:hypothetical protein [Acinetobacter modestus]MCH7330239.1 hypothetical protein [Acinetobacter modestus]